MFLYPDFIHQAVHVIFNCFDLKYKEGLSIKFCKYYFVLEKLGTTLFLSLIIAVYKVNSGDTCV